MLTSPFHRFAMRKRAAFHGAVVKQIKYILQMNLLTLLSHRWLKHINFIQAAYRHYRFIKFCRLQILYTLCMKSDIKNNQVWVKANNSTKYAILEKFLLKKLYEFSVAKCKYLYDTRSVNKGFSRNFVLWHGDAISNAMGRNFQIALPPPPKLMLYSRYGDLADFIQKFEVKNTKKKTNRSINFFEKSYY